MRSHKAVKNQLNFLGNTLGELFNPKHGLYLLRNEIDWDYFEKHSHRYILKKEDLPILFVLWFSN